jgi:YD repeat-containing protein
MDGSKSSPVNSPISLILTRYSWSTASAGCSGPGGRPSFQWGSTARIDALGRRTEFTYDAKGDVLTVTRLAGTGNAVTTTYTWESTWSQVASVTDPL